MNEDKSAYDSNERFMSYWHQINEVFLLNPRKVLEVGTGKGFLAQYLRARGLDVTTLDIDGRANPDYIGSVLKIPFTDKLFEVVACFEVLEHLPYECLEKALREMQRVSSAYLVLSLPDVGRAYRLNVQFPRLGEIKRLITLPRLKRALHVFKEGHYWEIEKYGYPLKRVLEDIRKTGLKVLKTYKAYEIPYHRFFVLRRQGS